MPSQHYNFDQYVPLPIVAATALAEACKSKSIFDTPAFDYMAAQPPPLPDIGTRLDTIDRGIADIKALFASRPAFNPYAMQVTGPVTSVTSPRICPICGENELRPQQSYCGPRCRKRKERMTK